MSYDPRLARRQYGVPDDSDRGAGKGSVRAARERLEAARYQRQPLDTSRIIGLPQRPNQPASQFSARNESPSPPLQNPVPAPLGRIAGNAFAQNPQWPLPSNADDVLVSRPEIPPRSPHRGPPPQRPPRPISEDYPDQPMSPDQYQYAYQTDDVFSPIMGTGSRPLTTSSAASTTSSLGSIPDFPVPQPPLPVLQQQQARRLPSLGPPPSSRRGPSSYYTQMSYVSPIAEESETRSDVMRSQHGSFASSNVFPSTVGDFYLRDEAIRSDDEETITSEYGRESPGSDPDDERGLVPPPLLRQASLGRRTKPSLTTIRSVDSLDKRSTPPKRKPVGVGPSAAGAGAGIGVAVLAAREGMSGRGSPGPPSGPLDDSTGLYDRSGTSSDSLPSSNNGQPRLGMTDSGETFGLGSGGLDAVHPLQRPTRQTSLADRVGGRRPPRLDVDAVREAESRGSMTSTPEMIRRATRLAANLERGKTASRLGLDFWEAGAPEKNQTERRRSGSLSDMLAAFPPPGEATPTGGRTPNAPRAPKWPPIGTEAASSTRSDRKSNPRRRRRCCGLPMWTFVTLLIVLLFLVAAAVIIPIVLIVLPKMRNTNASPAQTSSGSSTTTSPPTSAPTSNVNGQCDGIISCQNGGVAVPQADRTCNCVCINGFTGKTCGTKADAGCTTTNIAGTTNNATVGSGIPRLLRTAEGNFSIPLNPARLLSAFSNLGLTCTSENALITFNGLASRHVPVSLEASLEPSKVIPVLEQPHPDRGLRELHRRQAVGQVASAKPNQNAVATQTAAIASATSSQPVFSNATAIDFGRVGVLLALQESGKLDTAANAQEALQTFLTNDRKGSGNRGNTVSMGVLDVDLVGFTIKFQNGTTLQARPANTTAR